MSLLTSLIAQAKVKDPKLGKELEREFKVLASRILWAELRAPPSGECGAAGTACAQRRQGACTTPAWRDQEGRSTALAGSRP